MNRISFLLFFLNGVFSVTGGFAASANHNATQQWYVSALAGKDKNPGTKTKPFATLQCARDAVRKSAFRQKKPITIWVGEGIYSFSKTLALTQEDAGSEDAKVVWRAVPGKRVLITGSEILKKWTVVKDPKIVKKLDKKARGKVLSTSLKKLEIKDLSSITTPVELFFDDQVMTPARYPNEGWMSIGELPDGPKGDRFQVDCDRLANWVDDENLRAYGFWHFLWSASYTKLKKVDPATKEITVTKPSHYGFSKGKPFRIENAIGELDQPGEWYLNYTTQTILFFPPKSKTKTYPFISTIKMPLLSMNNTHHIIFSGFEFSMTRGTIIQIKNSANCQIDRCIIKNSASAGIQIKGGKHNRVTRCDVSQTGAAAISINGGNRKTLEPSNHKVSDCHIHHYARLKQTYQPAVSVNGVGNIVRHCHIHDAPHNAILYSGNNHLLEYNDVHDVCLVTADSGAFYTGRNWTTQGTRIEHNYFHNIGSEKGKKAEVHAVYFDDCASGNIVRFNIFEGGHRTVLIGGGRDHLIENNLFIHCHYAISFDARGIEKKQNQETLMKRLKQVPYTSVPWAKQYPRLANILNNNPYAPLGNIVKHNVFVGEKKKTIMYRTKNPTYKAMLKIENNWFGTDPKFVNKKAKNYTLKPNSPALKIGYKNISQTQIGIRKP